MRYIFDQTLGIILPTKGGMTCLRCL